MLLVFDKLPCAHARLDDPVLWIGTTAGDAKNHFPIHRNARISLDDPFDGFTELMLRFGRIYARTDSQIDIEVARRRNECRLMSPTRLNRINRSLGRDQTRGVFRRVFGEPLFQQADNFGGVDDGISAFYDMPYARVVQIPSYDYLEPTQSHLFPSDGPTRFRDDREIASHALLQHESTTCALTGIELSRRRPPVCRHAPRSQSDPQRSFQWHVRRFERLRRGNYA